MQRGIGKGAILGIVIIIIVIGLVAGLYYYYYGPSGKVYVYLSDPGNTSFVNIYFTITSIQAHSTKGWITISNKTETVSLSSTPQLITSANMPPGNYTEVRFVVQSVTITLANNFNVSATLPSNVFKVPIIGGLDIKPGGTEYLTISIGPHVTLTGNGSYILRPLIIASASNTPPS
ncbi:hypothetical protein Calag_0764 [Caldisphaera lagunensis DSM 15908]|uniref:DUF4382 domain-containing protein n=1 Tax=Caldisphaera lagunensis (strain DSM 15908 / JCM 11604 / ANMR 0165 / IC-154) TaxID=1056495 RepID=L0A9D3_CALLD|nr:DUF4382 domain-containing protein [Caldisphaera lagunensis]AFZ70508.1 hypothetical protein Calag_0764 [Caldisphaera lagunensis DSM 15908]